MKIVQLAFILITFNVCCQSIFLPKGYQHIKFEESSIVQEYHKAFDNVDAAITSHKIALYMNGYDTTKTVVNKQEFPDTPIFSFFYKKGNDKTVFLTFVTIGDIGYESVFIECRIEYIEFFVSDGYLLYFDPEKNQRKNNEY